MCLLFVELLLKTKVYIGLISFAELLQISGISPHGNALGTSVNHSTSCTGEQRWPVTQTGEE